MKRKITVSIMFKNEYVVDEENEFVARQKAMVKAITDIRSKGIENNLTVSAHEKKGANKWIN